MLKSLTRLLPLVAGAALIGALVLGTMNFVGPAIACLAIGVAASAGRAIWDQKAVLRLLQTQRRAQQAAYERLRRIQMSVESGNSKKRLAVTANEPAGAREWSDPRTQDVAELVSGAMKECRLLLIGGEPVSSVPSQVTALSQVALGTNELVSVPHGIHTHILIETSQLAAITPEERRWLRRTFRWQFDTVIAVPPRAGIRAQALVAEVLGSEIGVERRERLLQLSAPRGGDYRWGAA